MYCSFNNCKVSRPWDSKVVLNHHALSTMLYSWDKDLCAVIFFPLNHRSWRLTILHILYVSLIWYTQFSFKSAEPSVPKTRVENHCSQMSKEHFSNRIVEHTSGFGKHVVMFFFYYTLTQMTILCVKLFCDKKK